MSVPVITVDGPGGAGKGTLCFSLARYLGWRLLDSGALYRVVAHAAALAGADLADAGAVSALAAGLDVDFQPAAEGLTRVLLKGEDISAAIRTEACGAAASRVAAMRCLRDALRERQRALALAPGLVADGRDMGTVVFPDAPLKIYLTASVRARAQRRRAQLLARGESATLARLLEAIKTRDARDRNRQASPLKPAEDALLIDSTDISAQAIFDTVVNEARHRQLAFVAER